MTSIADRIRAGDPTALYAADVVQWCMDDPIGRALVDRVRALEAENAANIERWQVYESLCDEITAEKEAAEAAQYTAFREGYAAGYVMGGEGQ